MREHEIKNFKENASSDQICKGEAQPLGPILQKIYDLDYDEKPDYEAIIQAFVRTILTFNSPPSTQNYDWVQNS